MAKRLFVGSIAWATNDASLKAHFEQAGTVESANVIMDKMSGRSKGFGFVEMGSDAEAQEAVNKLNGSDLDGRKIVVSEARPKAQ
jgi:RNA recognition motif-containing protein